MDTNGVIFFLKNFALKKKKKGEKLLTFFGKGIKNKKEVIMIHYCQVEIGIQPKIT